MQGLSRDNAQLLINSLWSMLNVQACDNQGCLKLVQFQIQSYIEPFSTKKFLIENELFTALATGMDTQHWHRSRQPWWLFKSYAANLSGVKSAAESSAFLVWVGPNLGSSCCMIQKLFSYYIHQSETWGRGQLRLLQDSSVCCVVKVSATYYGNFCENLWLNDLAPVSLEPCLALLYIKSLQLNINLSYSRSKYGAFLK